MCEFVFGVWRESKEGSAGVMFDDMPHTNIQRASESVKCSFSVFGEEGGAAVGYGGGVICF